MVAHWQRAGDNALSFSLPDRWLVYFFYFDESGSRDPSVGTPNRPKDHLYVLLAVGMYERQWRPFDLEISRVKLELADYLARDGRGRYDLVDCEIKSN